MNGDKSPGNYFDKDVNEIVNNALSNSHFEETKPDDPMDISLASVLKTFEESGGSLNVTGSENDFSEDSSQQSYDEVDKASMMFIQDGEFRCLVCDKEFAKKAQLSAHVMIHSGVRPFKCEICQKSFNKLYSLQRHSKIHTGLRPFSCKLCDKTFKDQPSLKRHDLTHTGVQPFKCEICDTAFTVLGNLKRHMNLHTGERPHDCEICGKKFISKGNMKRHILTHTKERPHPCPVCGDTFAQQAALKRHLLVHTGEKPHECDVCKKAFATTSHLKRHINSHLGVRPFSCKVCYRLFTTSSNLKRHMHLHTDDLPESELDKTADGVDETLEEFCDKSFDEMCESDGSSQEQRTNAAENDGIKAFQEKINMLLSAHEATEAAGTTSDPSMQPLTDSTSTLEAIEDQHKDFITSFLNNVEMSSPCNGNDMENGS